MRGKCLIGSSVVDWCKLRHGAGSTVESYQFVSDKSKSIVMIKAKRLAERLAPQDFELAWEYWLGRQFHYGYSRPSSEEGVFEHIHVNCAGKRGEAVWCDIVVTPLRAHEFQFKPSPRVDDVITELADAGSDGAHAEIETTDAAIEWESRIAEIAPPRVRALALEHALSISHSTAVARRSAAEYVRLIRAFSDETVLEYLAVQLGSGRAPDKGLTDPFPGLMICQGDLKDAQECASSSITMFGAQVDPEHDGFHDYETQRTTDYKLRVALIADLLRNGA